MNDTPPEAIEAMTRAVQAYEPQATAHIIRSPSNLLSVMLEASRRALAAALPALTARHNTQDTGFDAWYAGQFPDVTDDETHFDRGEIWDAYQAGVLAAALPALAGRGIGYWGPIVAREERDRIRAAIDDRRERYWDGKLEGYVWFEDLYEILSEPHSE